MQGIYAVHHQRELSLECRRRKRSAGLQVGSSVLRSGRQIVEEKRASGADHPEDDRNRRAGLVQRDEHAPLWRRIVGSSRRHSCEGYVLRVVRSVLQCIQLARADGCTTAGKLTNRSDVGDEAEIIASTAKSIGALKSAAYCTALQFGGTRTDRAGITCQ